MGHGEMYFIELSKKFDGIDRGTGGARVRDLSRMYEDVMYVAISTLLGSGKSIPLYRSCALKPAEFVVDKRFPLAFSFE